MEHRPRDLSKSRAGHHSSVTITEAIRGDPAWKGGDCTEQLRQGLVAAINVFLIMINPPELGILEKQIQRVRRGQAVVLPITPETRGHETHSLPTIWKQHLADLLQRSGQVAPK